MTVTAPITVLDYFIARLKAFGVETVFGLPGGAVAPLLNRLSGESGLRFIVAKHESGAAAMAGGYARATGGLGVVITTTGPGALNATNHVAVANVDHVPLLLVSGQVTRRNFGKGATQESTQVLVDTCALFRECTRLSVEIGSAPAAPTHIEAALRSAVVAPGGAAHLSVPVDLWDETIDDPGSSSGIALIGTGILAITLPAPPPSAVHVVSSWLLSSTRPLLLLGNGARRALEDSASLRARLLDFCQRRAICVATTFKAKGIVPESHPLSLGTLSIGGSRRVATYLEDGRPDVLVVVGSSLGEWSTLNFSPRLRPTTHLVQVDLDPQVIGRSYRVDHAVLADAGAFLEALVIAADTADSTAGPDPVQLRCDTIAHYRHRPACPPVTAPIEGSDEPIKPQWVMAAIEEWLPPEATVCLDAGNTTTWFVQRVALDPPRRVFLPGGLASMGWSNAAVVGVKLGLPQRPAVVVTGDGGFLMNATEVATATQYGIGAIWIVLQDEQYGMVRQGMEFLFRREFTQDYCLPDIDLAGFAASLGAATYYVRRHDELKSALTTAAAGVADHRPQVVVVRIDERELAPTVTRFEGLHGGMDPAENAS